jgi:hypothetical protein
VTDDSVEYNDLHVMAEMSLYISEEMLRFEATDPISKERLVALMAGDLALNPTVIEAVIDPVQRLEMARALGPEFFNDQVQKILAAKPEESPPHPS